MRRRRRRYNPYKKPATRTVVFSDGREVTFGAKKRTPAPATRGAKKRRGGRKPGPATRARRRAANYYRTQLGKSSRGYRVLARRKAGRRVKNKSFKSRFDIATGRRGTIAFYPRAWGKGRNLKHRRPVATNPRRRRRNPADMSMKSWAEGFSPNRAMAVFQGKDMLTNVLYAAGGAVGGTIAGGSIGNTIVEQLRSAMPQISLWSNQTFRGALNGAISYSAVWAASAFLIKNPRQRTAMVTGGAIAAIVNLIMPGTIAGMLAEIPGLNQLPGIRTAAVEGMGAYVRAPGYQGVGAYVRAPGYQGVGGLGFDPSDAVAGIGYDDDALAGDLGAYVRSPSYQAVGDLGMYGCSHLDQ